MNAAELAAAAIFATPTPTRRRPAEKPTMNRNQTPAITFGQLATLLAVGLAGLLLVAGLTVGGVYFVVKSGGDRPPGPQIVDAETAARDSALAYSAALAAVYESTAQAIQTGRINSDVDLYEYTAATEDARKQSFRPFDAAAEAAIPKGDWTLTPGGRERAAQFCAEVAAGFRAAAEP